MQLGMVGLGRMGANMVRRLVRDGHELVVYDVSADAVNALGAGDGCDRRQLAAGPGVEAGASARDLGDGPGGVHRRHDHQLASYVQAGDVLIDGGNSYYRDDISRAEQPRAAGHPLRRRRHQRWRLRA